MAPSSAPARSLLVLSALATLVALVVLGRLAVFMADDARPNLSTFPSSAWEVRHSCVSAYFVAAGAAHEGRSVYRDELYTAPNDDGKGVRKPLMLGRFGIDVYEYPLPFLLVPGAVTVAVATLALRSNAPHPAARTDAAQS